MIAYLIYETDKFHSLNSRVVVGVFSNKQLLRSFVYNKIKDEVHLKVKEDGLENLGGLSKREYIDMTLEYFKSNNQTQHLWDWELEIHQIELNKEID
jgi:hypothetical protein